MLRVYCDFDGTAAQADVGSSLFRTFAGDRSAVIVQRYLEGEINARECLRLECEAIGRVRREDLEAFVDSCPLDPGLHELVSFCEAEGLPFTILSDGLDFYVGRLLRRAGLERVPFFANRAVWTDAGDGVVTLSPEFPYRDEHCDLCGNCKRNHIATLSADEDPVAYIGDGISDRCPVRFADIVFAKRDLVRYCQERNVTYIPYVHLGDVREHLRQVVAGERIRRRREAVMARRDLFIAE